MQMLTHQESVENNRIFREKYKEYLSQPIPTSIQQKTADLLQQVAQDAFLEGWIAAGGTPPYIINSIRQEK